MRDYDEVTSERLRIVNIVRSAAGTIDAPVTNVAAKSGLNRSIQESGWGQLARRAQAKAEASDAVSRRTEAAPPPHANRSSRDRCACERCGHESHSDTNAATNIDAAGPVVDGRRRADHAVCGPSNLQRPTAHEART